MLPPLMAAGRSIAAKAIVGQQQVALAVQHLARDVEPLFRIVDVHDDQRRARLQMACDLLRQSPATQTGQVGQRSVRRRQRG